MRLLFRGAAYFSLVVSAAIVLSLAFDAVDFLLKEPLGNLWGTEWTPRLGRYDVKTIVVGSILVTAVAMVIAAPLGMGAAIYLSEYASPRVRRILKPMLEILAGIPSVVLGFFAISWIAPNLVSRFFNPSNDANLMVAGIGVGVAITGIVGAFAITGFDSTWRRFHEIAFSNDLWQLNPDTDRLIQMFPEPFWEEATYIVGALTLAEALLVVVASVATLVLAKERPPATAPEIVRVRPERRRRASGD